MKTFIVDTHALVWYLDGDRRLPKRVVKLLDSDSVLLVFPTIVLAEVKYLFNKKRIRLTLEQVLEFIRADKRCRIHPFDISCVEFLDTRLNLHDAAIVSVAAVYNEILGMDAAVVSKDDEINKLAKVEVVW